MATDDELNNLYNATVYGEGDDKIGAVGQVYVSDSDGTPSWVTAKTGMFGSKETFLPLDAAKVDGDRITVPYSKSYIKDAPNLEADAELSESEETKLYEYYGVGGHGAGKGGNGDRDHAGGPVGHGDHDGRDGRDDHDRKDHDGPGKHDRKDHDAPGDRKDHDGHDQRETAAPGTPDRGVGHDGDDDETIVRHEERLKVGTESREAGHARIRKHVRTERQDVEVPVEREELSVERTPIADANPVDHAMRDGDDDGIDVTLREERAVAEKETVPVEEVKVDKHKVADTETVSADLASEDIDVDTDKTGEADAGRKGRDGRDGR